jgi:hypothetical protein
MKTGLRRWKFSEGEKAYFHRTERHVGISLKSLFVPLALSCVVLVGGKYLSGAINIDPHSTLFRLWPFNEVYLRQLANSPYSAADIRWFFTVVSCSNVIWLVYIVWKLAFELLRTDVAFPPGKSPGIFQMIIRFSAVYGVMLILGVFGGAAGFDTVQDSVFAPSFKQSIAVSAAKITMLLMFFLYFAVAYAIEYVGLGLRYLMARTLGYFVAEH